MTDSRQVRTPIRPPPDWRSLAWIRSASAIISPCTQHSPPGDRQGPGRRRRYAERDRQGVDGARRADTERSRRLESGDGDAAGSTDIRHRADYGPIREEFFGKKMPAHTLVAVSALAAPEFLIEIEAIAVL